MPRYKNLGEISRSRTFLDGIRSLVSGVVSIFSFGTFNSTPSYEEMFGTDEELMASDWQAVGDDLRTVIRRTNDN